MPCLWLQLSSSDQRKKEKISRPEESSETDAVSLLNNPSPFFWFFLKSTLKEKLKTKTLWYFTWSSCVSRQTTALICSSILIKMFLKSAHRRCYRLSSARRTDWVKFKRNNKPPPRPFFAFRMTPHRKVVWKAFSLKPNLLFIVLLLSLRSLPSDLCYLHIFYSVSCDLFLTYLQRWWVYVGIYWVDLMCSALVRTSVLLLHISLSRLI